MDSDQVKQIDVKLKIHTAAGDFYREISIVTPSYEALVDIIEDSVATFVFDEDLVENKCLL